MPVRRLPYRLVVTGRAYSSSGKSRRVEFHSGNFLMASDKPIRARQQQASVLMELWLSELAYDFGGCGRLDDQNSAPNLRIARFHMQSYLM